jgi:hypothetical protein
MLIPLATLVTPNLDEASTLLQEEVRTPEQMARAGRALLELGARAALVTGGHLPGTEIVDVLVTEQGATRSFAQPRPEPPPRTGPAARSRPRSPPASRRDGRSSGPSRTRWTSCSGRSPLRRDSGLAAGP